MVILSDVSSALIEPSESRAWTKSHSENLLSAMRSSCEAREVIEIITSSGARILFNKNLLILFSKTIRTCLAEIPCYHPQAITMADSNIRALKKVNEILENNLHGVTTEFYQDQEDLKEVVEAAKAIGIEMKNVRISTTRGKARSKAEISSFSKAKVDPHVVELEEEPVTEEVDDEGNVEDRNLGYYDDSPIEITVDISSDEDEEEDTYEARMFRSSQDTFDSSDMDLLDDEAENAEESESLEEKNEKDAESENQDKISFSFLSGIDRAKTSTEIDCKKTVQKQKTEDATVPETVDEPRGASFLKFPKGLSSETEPLPSKSSSSEQPGAGISLILFLSLVTALLQTPRMTTSCHTSCHSCHHLPGLTTSCAATCVASSRRGRAP